MATLQKESDTGHASPQMSEGEESEAEQSTKLNPPPPPGDVEEMELQKIPVKTTQYGYPEIIGRPSRCCKVEHLKYAVFGFNFILAMLGFAVVALAIWIRADPDFWEYNTSLDIGDFYKACYMFMVAGLVILIVAFLGCCGALNEAQWMLITYIVISFIFFVVEVTAVILIWHAPFNKTIRVALEDTIKEKVEKRGEDDSTRMFIDFIQAHLECCGSVSSREYNGPAPYSCQNPITGNVFTTGCASVMLKYLQSKAGIVGGIGIPILLFHLLSLVVSFCLLQDIRKESRYSI